jgi:hypothetical protein
VLNLTSDGDFVLDALDGTDMLRVSDNGTYGYNASGGRTVLIGSDQKIGTSSSTIRNKQDVSTYEFNEQAVLSIEPKRFRYTEAANGGDNSAWEYGFIAEEAVEAGLSELCGFDETGQPDYFFYEKMCVAQQQIIRTLWAKVEALEARLTD